MNKCLIAYEFCFNVAVKRPNCKEYHSHKIIGIGLDYALAVSDIFFTLKKRKTRIVRINSVQVLRIVFAFDAKGERMSASLQAFPPVLPDDLNAELQKLQKQLL